MQKKLYKAKKSWIIGVIIGSVLMVTSATGHADNINNNTVIDYSSKFETNSPNYSINLFKDSKANKDANAYVDEISPNPQFNAWSATGNINQITGKDLNASTFQDIPEVKTGMQMTIPSDSLQYRYSYQGKNPNYQHITALSSQIANESDCFINNYIFTYRKTTDSWNGDLNGANIAENTHTYVISYTNDKRSIDVMPQAVDGRFDKEEFIKVRAESIKNGMATYTMPKVTFDDEGYTSFIQSSAIGHGAFSYSFDYTSDLQGYTFKNGEQLPLTYFLKDVNKAAKYLRGIAYKHHNSPYYSSDKENGLPYTGGKYVNGSTSYYLLNDGIYVFMPESSGVSNWNWALAVRLPMVFVKDQYLGLFNKFDQKTEDQETLKNDISSAIKTQIENGIIDEGTGRIIANKVERDAAKIMEKQMMNIGENGIIASLKSNFNSDNALKMISSYFTDTIKGIFDLQYDAAMLGSLATKDIDLIKNTVDVANNTFGQGYDVWKMLEINASTNKMPHNADTLEKRYSNFKKTRNYHIDNYKKEENNGRIVTKTLLGKNKKATSTKGWKRKVAAATVAVVSAAAISIFAIFRWNTFNLSKLASNFGIKIKNKWLKK